MRTAGIDIGSRTTKLVVIDDGLVVLRKVVDTSYDPVARCRELLNGVEYDRIVSTGYGRHLFSKYWEAEAVTELTAVALGSRHVFASCRGVLDIGGQDTKVVTLTADGGLSKFEMNDRCAAGTGRFLEVMAAALSLSMEDFVSQALQATASQTINSMCTVFAESEVVSLVAKGANRSEVALGIHDAIARRTISMLRKTAAEGDLLFVGGVAKNACMKSRIEKELGRPLFVPQDPQTIVALGAALHAARLRG